MEFSQVKEKHADLLFSLSGSRRAVSKGFCDYAEY